MSFTTAQTGIETYDGVTQLLFPHPPVILERFAEGKVARAHAVTITGKNISVQWAGVQDKLSLRIKVRTLTAANMATLEAIRDAVGLVYVKLAAGVATTYLCALMNDEDQKWVPMVADHPETKTDGSAVDTVFLVYETEIALLRME
jgi:hypothetical protein